MIDLKGIEWKDVEWICLVQERNQWRDIVYMAINIRAKNFSKAGRLLAC